MLPAQTQRDAVSGPSRLEEDTDQVAGPSPTISDESVSTDRSPPMAELFPPGPLASVRIVPNRLRVECRGSKPVRAEAMTVEGRVIRPAAMEMDFKWELWGRIGALSEIQGKTDQILVHWSR